MSVATRLRSVVVLLLLGSLGVADAQPVPFAGVPWVGYNVGTSAYPGNPDIHEAAPQAIASADFDGDGDLDLAVANYNALSPGDDRGDSGFALLFNQGDGTFGEPVHTLFTTKGSFDIVVGDFDEDGHPDLALPNSGQITNQRGTTVVLFLNDGSGGFTLAGEFPVQEQPEALATGDFNDDGHLDLVANSHRFDSEQVAVLFGTGTGSFASQQLVAVGDVPGDLATGDFDGDGDDDLALDALGDLTVILSDGVGGFGDPVNLSGTEGQAPIVSNVAAADLDGNGTVDLVYGTFQSSGTGGEHVGDEMAVRLGNGDGTFAEPVYYDLGDLTLDAIEPADLDGDGDLDLAVANASGRTGDGVLTLTNDGAGGFTLAVHVAAGQTTIDLTVADLDGDGDADIATADRSSLAVTIHDNPGDGAFPSLGLFPNGIDGNSRLDAGDVDGDGDLDVITSNEVVGGSAALVKNNGDGTFAPGIPVDHAPGEINRGPARAKLRDLDGDGDLDLLYNDPHTDFVTGYDFWIGLNDGTGAFGPLVEHDLNTCGNGDVDAFDLDGDGDLDVVNLEELNCAGSDFGNRLFINLNDGDATFAAPLIEQISAAPRDLAGGDLDEDGVVDLVTAHWGPSGLRNVLNVHLGNGDGTFEEERVHAVGSGPLDLVVADLDGDDHLDLASANSGSDDLLTKQETMSVLWGDGTGAFSPAETYYAPYSPDLFGATGLAAGDVDGDGDLDLMMTTVANGAMLYVNDGARGFASPYRLGLTWDAFDPFFADFTGDGRPDLLTLGRFAEGGNGVGLLRGTETMPTADEDVPAAGLPEGYALSSAYPNPFRSRAQLSLTVAEAQPVRVEVFDALGRRVAVLHDGPFAAGTAHTFTLAADGLPSGVYVVRASGTTFAATRRVTLLR